MNGSAESNPGAPRESRGFSLIESVVALAVVAVALVCLVSAGQYAVEATAVSTNRLRAATLAGGLAEEMQLGGPWRGQLEGAFDDAPGFRWKAEVSRLQGTAARTPCRQVTLSVRFPGMAGSEEEVSFVFIARSD